jgi:hypothetical protein
MMNAALSAWAETAAAPAAINIPATSILISHPQSTMNPKFEFEIEFESYVYAAHTPRISSATRSTCSIVLYTEADSRIQL